MLMIVLGFKNDLILWSLHIFEIIF